MIVGLIEAKAANGDCNVCLDADRRKSNVFLNCGFDMKGATDEKWIVSRFTAAELRPLMIDREITAC